MAKGSAKHQVDGLGPHMEQKNLIIMEMATVRAKLEEENQQLRDRLEKARLVIRLLKEKLQYGDATFRAVAPIDSSVVDGETVCCDASTVKAGTVPRRKMQQQRQQKQQLRQQEVDNELVKHERILVQIEHVPPLKSTSPFLKVFRGSASRKEAFQNPIKTGKQTFVSQPKQNASEARFEKPAAASRHNPSSNVSSSPPDQITCAVGDSVATDSRDQSTEKSAPPEQHPSGKMTQGSGKVTADQGSFQERTIERATEIKPHSCKPRSRSVAPAERQKKRSGTRSASSHRAEKQTSPGRSASSKRAKRQSSPQKRRGRSSSLESPMRAPVDVVSFVRERQAT